MSDQQRLLHTYAQGDFSSPCFSNYLPWLRTAFVWYPKSFAREATTERSRSAIAELRLFSGLSQSERAP